MKATITQGAWKAGRSDDKELAKLLLQLRNALNGTERALAALQTVLSAVATSIWFESMPADVAWSMEIEIIAYATDGAAAGYRRLVRCKRIGTAAPVLLSVDTVGTDVEDIGAWNVAVGVVDDGIGVNVTGDATRTVDWRARVQIQEAPAPAT